MQYANSLVKNSATLARRPVPVLEEERRLMGVAEENRWPFRVLGIAPVPTEPIFANDWWLVPATQDKSAIPAHALERIHAIYIAGIRPKAFVIAHEAPKQLAAPAGAPQVSRFEFYAGQLAEHSATVARAAGRVLVTVAPIILAGVGMTLMAMVGLAGAVLTDPCLIAIMEDDVWVEIDSWMS